MTECTTSSTRSLPWFRVYTDLTHDPRFRRQPLHVRWAWIALLSIARRCTKPGYLIIDGDNMTVADLADEAAISIEEAQQSWDYFVSKLLVVSYRGSWRVDGWDRRQFESDSSTERVRKHRSRGAKAERDCNVSCNVEETCSDNRVQSTDTCSISQVEIEQVAARSKSVSAPQCYLDAERNGLLMALPGTDMLPPWAHVLRSIERQRKSAVSPSDIAIIAGALNECCPTCTEPNPTRCAADVIGKIDRAKTLANAARFIRQDMKGA